MHINSPIFAATDIGDPQANMPLAEHMHQQKAQISKEAFTYFNYSLYMQNIVHMLEGILSERFTLGV